MSDSSEDVAVGHLPVDEMRRDGEALMFAHWEEIASDKTVPLDPDWVKYHLAEESGALVSVGARVNGEPVGYFVGFILDPHPHYRSWSLLHNDIFYVVPKHRGGRIAAKLTLLAKSIARGRGLKCIVWHCKPDTEMHSLMDRSTKHRLWEHTYIQEI